MHAGLLSVAFLSLPFVTRAGQIPFTVAAFEAQRWNDGGLWTNLSARPEPNAAGHLIFDTVNSLLQHWQNTRYRNGHTIVPAIVPTGTLLYHGRADGNLPTVPEWVATDPEHAFPFCDRPRDGDDDPEAITGCWQLTLVATRPLQVLYFDGSSAAAMDDGPLDAQDLLVWGRADPSRRKDDRSRIDGLCAWGQELRIDGYVRMEMDFEIMLCDFTVGVEPVSADYLAAWHSHPFFVLPSMSSVARSRIAVPIHQEPTCVFPIANGTSPSPPREELRVFETVRAGAWHNHRPGDTRILLDLTRLVSFYDPLLAPSLVAARVGQERWDHRPANISAADLKAVIARLRTVLTRGGNAASGSGVDWQTLHRVVVDRYADRLELLAHLLNTTTSENLAERARMIQTRLRVMLTPYTLYDAHPQYEFASEVPGKDHVWAAPVWRACATRHTAYIHTSSTLSARLTPSERMLLGAVDETIREICRVVVRMWAAGVHAGLDFLLSKPMLTPDHPLEPPSTTTVHVEIEEDSDLGGLVQDWTADTQALMAWLDWGVWIKCRPACGVEETCYMPTWPYFWRDMEEGGRGDDGEGNLWRRPQPRCVRQVEPYSTL
ncbi:hypothetical protein C8R43DRAFT_1147301 [Mycena crocata]|nr:hypothetical protein C8R43DRAFT_1147301 [Mycena crocata]